MDILVLNYEYPPLGGGAAPVCRDLAVGMARAGHRVTVVTMGYTGLPEREARDGVEIIRLKCLRARAHACMPWEQYSYILAAKRFLKRQLRTRRYDVCHAHFVIPTGPVARWLKRRYGVPYVITAHGSDVEGHNSKVWMRAMHRLLRPAWRGIVRDAHAVAAPSAYLMRLMRKTLADGSYALIPNGLDVEKYGANAGPKERRMLVMGRMQAAKNVQTILRAVARIPDDIWEDWTLDILGDGPYREKLESLAQALGIQTRVTFHGWIENGSDAQMDLLRRSAVHISASRFENCPMGVLEGLASGCRPVLSDIEGHRQFFEDGGDALFFPADDADTLAAELTTLLREGPKPEEGRQACPPAFDARRVTAQYIDILEKAAGERDAGEDSESGCADRAHPL